MEKFIEVNGNWLFSDEHFVLTERGWLKAKELEIGDKVIGVKGISVIKNIKECGIRPDAPIVEIENGAVISVDGYSVDNDDMHWIVNCPNCEQELEYTGYFDSNDINKCKCGTKFKTRRIYFDNDSYID